MNCSITENYFAEKARMTENCRIACVNCPLSVYNNGEKITCTRYETKYIDRAMEIVQKWSDEHPQKTLLDDLKEKYPNYNIGNDGVPIFCPYELGYEGCEVYRQCSAKCVECWNRPYEVVKDEM